MPFMQVLTGSMKRSLLEGNTIGNTNLPFSDDPVHHADVFGEAAAAGLEAGGAPTFL